MNPYNINIYTQTGDVGAVIYALTPLALTEASLEALQEYWEEKLGRCVEVEA